jgi:hypothetical protein
MRIEVDIYGNVTEHEDAPATPITLEQLAEQTTANAKAVLDSTGWVIEKYTDLVVVQKLMTDAEFNTKYATELAQRNAAREVLK